MGSSLFALGIGIRAAIVGAIAFLTVWLVSLGHYYATALVCAAVASLILIDTAKRISQADRMLERFVDGFAANQFERPAFAARRYSGFSRLVGAMDRHAKIANNVRVDRQQHTDYLQLLTDHVAVVLLLVSPDGSVTLLNRAARQFAEQAVFRLSEIALIGESGADELLALPAGQRAIFKLADNRRMLASAARFSANGQVSRLISLQHVGSELDAIEIKAWQDLVRILAHEMMNSLTPISSLAESLPPLLRELRTADGERAASAEQNVVTAIETIARRSTGLMSFVERYRKVANLSRAILKPQPLAEIVNRIDRLMGPAFVAAAISYSSKMDSPDLMVEADADLLEQALINLLQNAIEAVAGGSNPMITLGCARVGDDKIAIDICDNGPGVDPASVDRIFVPFFTTKIGGSGIGLSLTRQIALAHNGEISLMPLKPTGTRFRLTLKGEGKLLDFGTSAFEHE